MTSTAEATMDVYPRRKRGDDATTTTDKPQATKRGRAGGKKGKGKRSALESIGNQHGGRDRNGPSKRASTGNFNMQPMAHSSERSGSGMLTRAAQKRMRESGGGEGLPIAATVEVPAEETGADADVEDDDVILVSCRDSIESGEMTASAAETAACIMDNGVVRTKGTVAENDSVEAWGDADKSSGEACSATTDAAREESASASIICTEVTVGTPVAAAVQDVTDIDLLHAKDPRYCTAYIDDYYKYMLDLEDKYRAPKPGFLDRPTENEVTPNMRAILIDWLVEVAEEYKLHAPTLYLSVNYIDRVLKHLNVPRKKLQLVGCSCMLMASKYEEIYAPSVDDFVYISDSTYTQTEVLDMERKCLSILDFRLTVSTLMTFLPRYLQAVSEDDASQASFTLNQKYLSLYLADLSLVEYDTRHYRPSVVAAACLDLSRRTLGVEDHWCASLVKYAGITAKELLPCVTLINGYHRRANKNALKATYTKYKDPKFHAVATSIIPLSEDEITIEDESRASPTPTKRSFGIAAAR